MPFLAQLVYREYHARVQALQSTQKLIPPPEDVSLTSQPLQEESVTAPKEQDGTEMEVEDLSEEKTESIPLELENQHPLESEMPVTIETVPATESHISATEEKTVEEKEEAIQQVTETETKIEPMEQ